MLGWRLGCVVRWTSWLPMDELRAWGCVHMMGGNPRCQHECCWLCLYGWTSATHDASEASHSEVLASVKAALKPAEEIEELHLDPATARAAMDVWNTFVSMSESREIAVEAISAALFEGAPSLQSLFTTPRAVQAMRFLNGLMSFVMRWTHLNSRSLWRCSVSATCISMSRSLAS